MGNKTSEVEDMVKYDKLFSAIYLNKKVLITGHSGFKGSWLKLWLVIMGAIVEGLSLEPKTAPNHISLLNQEVPADIIDINNYDKVKSKIKSFSPDIVFHLAAQPLVRYSYANPFETFSTNIMGTAHLLEASKNISNLKAIVVITSDKCYENKESIWSYRETDALGGYDPYSASKACSEIITNCYRNSFFNIDKFNDQHSTLIATARAGNVIGGGDWSEDRLIPDLVKSALESEKTIIRSPKSTRPWQHVLEPLAGYLLLGQKLLEGKKDFACSWNFGPTGDSTITVEEVLLKSKKYWDKIDFSIQEDDVLHEAKLLELDSKKANSILKWKGIWSIEDTIDKTLSWYKHYYEFGAVNSEIDLSDYIKKAISLNQSWV